MKVRELIEQLNHVDPDLSGYDAIKFAEDNDIDQLWKYNDALEDACYVTIEQAYEVVEIDPSLIALFPHGDCDH